MVLGKMPHQLQQGDVMAWETYAQIAVVFGTGLTIVLVLRNLLKDLRSELKEDIQAVCTKVDGIQQQIASQGERIARIEGMLSSHIPALMAQEVSAPAEHERRAKA